MSSKEEGKMGFITELFDFYSLRARLFPSVLILSPALLIPEVVAAAEKMASIWIVAIVAAIGISILANFVRERGKKLEPLLFNEWGGMPTSTLLFSDDPTFSAVSKNAIYHTLTSLQSTPVPTPDEQKKDPQLARNSFDTLVTWLRENRRENPLVLSENAWYGFRRNVYASRVLGLIIAALAFGINLATIVLEAAHGSPELKVTDILGPEQLFELIYDVGVVIYLASRSKDWVKTQAFVYARALVSASLQEKV
jgi:hypothetical protein